jgi:hypothetical protein
VSSVAFAAGLAVTVGCVAVPDDDEMAHAPETRLTTNRLARREQRKMADEAARDAMGSTPTTSVASKAANQCGMGASMRPGCHRLGASLALSADNRHGRLG